VQAVLTHVTVYVNAQITVSFMQRPDIDFNLQALKFNIMQIPGFSAWLQTFIKSTLASVMVRLAYLWCLMPHPHHEVCGD